MFSLCTSRKKFLLAVDGFFDTVRLLLHDGYCNRFRAITDCKAYLRMEVDPLLLVYQCCLPHCDGGCCGTSCFVLVSQDLLDNGSGPGVGVGT